jgi:hypothetical protein
LIANGRFESLSHQSLNQKKKWIVAIRKARAVLMLAAGCRLLFFAA